MAKKINNGITNEKALDEFPNETAFDYFDTKEMNDMLYATRAEIETLADMEEQRGTPIPALFNQFYRFIQNPSSVSIDTYKRMIDTDDTIGSGVDFLTTCLAARIGQYQHPNKEITEFVNTALSQMDNGIFNTIKEILSSTWAGFSLSEKVWQNNDLGFVPKRVVTLPPQTIFFETDRTGRITQDGILQYQRSFNGALAGNLFGFNNGFTLNIRPDINAKLGDMPYPVRTSNTYTYMSIRIPYQKVIHHSFDAQGKFGNPYGRSLLRRAYKWYVLKDAVLKMLAVALDRKGTPLTVVYADPNTTLMDGNSHDANLPPQKQKRTRADLAAKQAFENVHNDTTIILPGKKGQIYDLDFVSQDSNSQAFIDTINLCNKSIMRALLIPPLVFNDGDGSGSYALGENHSETFDAIMDGMNEGVKQCLIHQLIKEIIAFNFPESAWKKDGFGDFAKRDFTMSEKDKLMAMYQGGIDSGIIDSTDLNDLNQMRDTIGFQPLDAVPEDTFTAQEEAVNGDNDDKKDGESTSDDEF